MLPDGWQLPPPDLVGSTKYKALEALRTDRAHAAPERLVLFYDTDGEYAGASFTQLGPIDPVDITPADLLATTLLSVRIGPGATRRLLNDGSARDTLLRKLRDIPDGDLASARSPALTAMAGLCGVVKRALSAEESVRNPNAWVTASKLCARKRPDLFPVRDKEVCDYLGFPSLEFQVDWQIFRSLIGDPDIIAAIDVMARATAAAAAGRRLQVEQSRLRLLDAALWTYAMSRG